MNDEVIDTKQADITRILSAGRNIDIISSSQNNVVSGSDRISALGRSHEEQSYNE